MTCYEFKISYNSWYNQWYKLYGTVSAKGRAKGKKSKKRYETLKYQLDLVFLSNKKQVLIKTNRKGVRS
jgi:hypothetical protein